ncbi:MAG: hypothetical protein IT305_13880 [Chloroflexi bacterium]|nr:hypothetical protein [Chloroflexota bacterium]
MATLVMRRPFLAGLLAVALVVVLLFGGRAALRLTYRLTRPPPPPRETNVDNIAGWMTVPYVARAYRVPPSVLFDALGIPFEGHRATTLDDLAAETGRTPADVLQTVRDSVTAWQETHPPPPRGPGGPERTRPGPASHMPAGTDLRLMQPATAERRLA